MRWSSPPGQIEQVPRGLAFLAACLPCLQCIFLPPIPPPPFPGVEGGDFLFSYARGCAPCIPGAEPGRHRSRGRTTHPAGACLLCRLPTLPSVYFPAPYSPDPLPRWGRGRPRLFHARGFAPCIPRAEPGRHRSRGRIARWRRGLPCLAGSAGVSGTRLRRGGFGRRLDLPPPSPAGGLPPRFSFHALTGAAGCDILVYRTEPPRRTARKQKETPYRTAIPERRKGENRA